MAEFGERLKSLRTQQGLTQGQLASMLGVSRSTIAGYEAPSKQRKPDFDVICRLSDIFNVSADYLLGRTDRRYPVYASKEALNLGRRLQAIREHRGYTRRELADALGIPFEDIVRYEGGVETLPEELIKAAAKILEIEPDYIKGHVSDKDMEEFLGETWFRIHGRLSPIAKKYIENFIAFVELHNGTGKES